MGLLRLLLRFWAVFANESWCKAKLLAPPEALNDSSSGVNFGVSAVDTPALENEITVN